jgi:hypothetical protein
MRVKKKSFGRIFPFFNTFQNCTCVMISELALAA